MQATRPGLHAPTILVGKQHLTGGSEDLEQVRLGRTRYYKLLTPVNGAVQFGFTGERDGARVLVPGDVLFIEPQVFARFQVPAGVQVAYLAFIVRAAALVSAGGRALRLAAGEGDQPLSAAWWGCQIPSYVVAEVAGSCAAYVRLMADSWWRDDRGRLRANVLLASVLERLVGLAQQGISTAPDVPGLTDERLRDAVAHAVAHLRTFRTVSDMAAHAGMGRNHFTNLFRDQTGEAPAAWLRRVRIQTADHLLTSQTYDLAHIAQETGFSSASALCNAFRTAFGCTPGERRARMTARPRQ